MSRSYSEKQIREIVGEYLAGTRLPEVCFKYGIAEATLHRWRSRITRGLPPTRLEAGSREALVHEVRALAAVLGRLVPRDRLPEAVQALVRDHGLGPARARRLVLGEPGGRSQAPRGS